MDDNRLIKDLNRLRKRLISKAGKRGLYENFGQAEVRELEDRHIDISDYSPRMQVNRGLINDFDLWCQNYTGRREE